MNLVYLADGRFGACWGKANKLWDIAGGLILAELAGAKIRYEWVDQDRYLVNYLGATPACWPFFEQRTKDVLRT